MALPVHRRPTASRWSAVGLDPTLLRRRQARLAGSVGANDRPPKLRATAQRRARVSPVVWTVRSLLSSAVVASLGEPDLDPLHGRKPIASGWDSPNTLIGCTSATGGFGSRLDEGDWRRVVDDLTACSFLLVHAIPARVDFAATPSASWCSRGCAFRPCDCPLSSASRATRWRSRWKVTRSSCARSGPPRGRTCGRQPRGSTRAGSRICSRAAESSPTTSPGRVSMTFLLDANTMIAVLNPAHRDTLLPAITGRQPATSSPRPSSPTSSTTAPHPHSSGRCRHAHRSL